MNNWLNDYLSALEARDALEQANNATIDAYTKLADRTAAMQKAAVPSGQLTPDKPASPTPSLRKGKDYPVTIGVAVRSDSPVLTEVVQLRANLSVAQKSKASLESQLFVKAAELAALTASSATDSKAAALIARQKLSLERKLKDRDSELREKARLVESVQDEMVGLQLELNIAEERAKKVEGENKDLVDRWMKRVGKEAEEMNEEYSWK